MENKKIIKTIKELFTHEFICNILCTASYDSSWFAFGVHQDTDKQIYEDAKTCYECREDIWTYVLMNNGYILIEDVEEEEDYKLSLKDLIKGFKTLMLNYPQHYANIMTKNSDYYDCDAVIQCAIFGEIVYA